MALAAVAIKNADKAGGLLCAIEAFEGHPNTKAALRLLPHVFVRPGELRFAEWGDFDVESREFLAGSAPNAVVNTALEGLMRAMPGRWLHLCLPVRCSQSKTAALR